MIIRAKTVNSEFPKHVDYLLDDDYYNLFSRDRLTAVKIEESSEVL